MKTSICKGASLEYFAYNPRVLFDTDSTPKVATKLHICFDLETIIV